MGATLIGMSKGSLPTISQLFFRPCPPPKSKLAFEFLLKSSLLKNLS